MITVILEKAKEVLKDGFVCDNCLGRQYAGLLSGMNNEQRGKIVRQIIAMMIDAGEKIDIDNSNFYGIKFRNVKIEVKKPEKCKLCKNFFREVDAVAKRAVKSLKGIDFETFLVGSVPTDEMKNAEDKIWDEVGIENVEPIKSEINREVGKRIEKITGKKFSLKNPDVTVVVDLNAGKIRAEIRSVYVLGKYQKLIRGIPQTKWVCRVCKGKGCKHCSGTGKMYATSVQEQIEKPFLKVCKSRSSSFHGAGREDVDARCLAWRPFVIEIEKPIKRKIDLKKIAKEINKSKKVKVRGLKFVTKDMTNILKTERMDKTYAARVEFENPIDRKKLREVKKLEKSTIMQRTPTRVVHRRADLTRKRLVKKISWKILGAKKIEFKIKGEAGLYIKELITGDQNRTQPNIADLLSNKVKKIELDVVKIHG